MADEDINIQEQAHADESEESVSARKELLIFWARMIGWLATGVAAPISVFAIKFGLFSSYGYQVNTDELGNVTEMRIAVNGWGIISVCLIAFAAISIINTVIEAYSNQYSYTKQILIGIKNRIIPLAIVIAICYFLKGCLEQVIFCAMTIGISQIAAIALNPLPKWKAKKQGKEDYSDLITGVRNIIKDYNIKRTQSKGDK